MIPIPQSPWTLAIAELVGMRLATAGSSAHPADLLANLLPSGDPLPEGWFDQFLAGTPIPGYSPLASAAGASVSSAPTENSSPFLEAFAPTAGSGSTSDDFPTGQSPLAFQTGGTSPASPSSEASTGMSGSLPAAPGASQGGRPGWETLRLMLPGGSDENPSSSAAPRPVTGVPVAIVRPSLPCGDAASLAPGSAPAPSSVSRSTATTRGTARSAIRSASGGIGPIQITPQFDGKKLATEMYLIAKQVAEQSVGRTLSGYATQLKGSGWNR